MFTNTLWKCWLAVVNPQVRLPADFPFSPKSSGKLYLKSLACYILGTVIPLGFFVAFTWYIDRYDPQLEMWLFAESRFYFVLAAFSALTFLTGFGAQLLYIRVQIHKQGKTMRDVLSLNRKHFGGSTLKLIGWGVATFLVAAILQQGIGAVWPFQLADPTADLINKMHGFSFAIMALLAVTAPIFEEVVFRGFVYGSIRTNLHKKLPPPSTPGYGRMVRRYDLIACFASALMFGLVHMNLAGLPLYVVTGMVFAEAYRRSGSLYVPIIGHFINNGLLMLLMMVLK